MSIRAFMAFDLPDSLRKKAVSLQAHFFPLLPRIKTSWLMADAMHITLIFFELLKEKDVNAVEDVMHRTCVQLTRLKISLTSVNAFPSMKNCKVLWLQVGSGIDIIKSFEKTISAELQTLGYRSERNYVPHLTLARFSSEICIEDAVRAQMNHLVASQAIEGSLESVSLYKSTLSTAGAIHTLLSKASLETRV